MNVMQKHIHPSSASTTLFDEITLKYGIRSNERAFHFEFW